MENYVMAYTSRNSAPAGQVAVYVSGSGKHCNRERAWPKLEQEVFFGSFTCVVC